MMQSVVLFANTKQHDAAMQLLAFNQSTLDGIVANAGCGGRNTNNDSVLGKRQAGVHEDDQGPKRVKHCEQYRAQARIQEAFQQAAVREEERKTTGTIVTPVKADR
jgi:hypothetical protein